MNRLSELKQELSHQKSLLAVAQHKATKAIIKRRIQSIKDKMEIYKPY
ncbi:MAG: hypothetical protein KZQ83_17780 [gamma proteobacterium symbiont of Taylorina sp.]|nr:hypothetical protein [gamma proteobacterium symbiont of Taylorina sp.]